MGSSLSTDPLMFFRDGRITHSDPHSGGTARKNPRRSDLACMSPSKHSEDCATAARGWGLVRLDGPFYGTDDLNSVTRRMTVSR